MTVDERRHYQRSYYHKNKKKINKSQKEYVAKNKDKHNERCKKYNKNLYVNRPAKLLWQYAKRRAKIYSMDFNIIEEDIIVPEFCPILEQKLERNTRYTMTLDRIDNSIGYVKGNVQVISSKANVMKSDATPEELIKFANSLIR